MNRTESHRIAQVEGQSLVAGHEGPFAGSITFDSRGGDVHYQWRLEDSKAAFLALKGGSVSSRVVPPAVDAFDYALAHAIEGIRRYRINRMNVFEPERWEWKDGAA